MKPTFVALAFLAAIAAGPRARAADEREWQLGVNIGAASVTADARSTWGFAAALNAEYGLTDAWALRADLGTSLHSVSSSGSSDTRPTGTLEAGTALAGVEYTIDVLRLLPYANLELGALQLAGAVQTPRVLFVAALGIGADYFVTRQWKAGAHFQYLFAPFDLIAQAMSLGSSPYSFAVTVRVSRVF